MDLLVLLRVKILFMYLSPHSIKDWKILEILLLFLLSGVIEKLKNLYMKDKSIQIMELNLCQGYNQDSGTSRWKGTIPNHSDSWLVCSLDENSTVEPETRMQVLGEQQEAKARPHTRRTHILRGFLLGQVMLPLRSFSLHPPLLSGVLGKAFLPGEGDYVCLWGM